MKVLRFILVAGLIALAITSCKKSNTPTPAKQVDVYVAGGIQALSTINNANIACYWKNGSIVKLSDSLTAALATGITIDQNDVYVAGYHLQASNGNAKAVYWKNGKEVALTDGTAWATANAIAVDNGNVYVAGDIFYPQGKSVAAYWKNGALTVLTDGTANASISGIAISNGNVYLAGTDGNDGKVWKNGVAITLNRAPTSYTAVNSIVVVGSDIYVGGYDGVYGAAYWKNNNPTYLTNNYASFTSGIAVDNDGIYVAGNINPVNQIGQPNLWVDDVQKPLQSGYSSTNIAYGVAASGQDIYVAAEFGTYAGYWRNGVAIVLSNYASANSIAVVAH